MIERVDQPIDLAVHDPRQRRQVEPDPVVGQPVLGEVVGPDLVGPVAAADHRAAGGRIGLALLRPAGGRRAASAAPDIALALFLCWLFSSWISTTRPVGRWVIRTAESVVLTDWPPGPGRALDVDPEVLLLVDLDLDLVDLGHDDDRRGRGVDPAGRLRRRDALDAVDAALELEAAVGAVAVDLDDRLLDPADPGLVEAQELRRELVPLGVADVHPVELRGEQGGLVAAGAGPDLHDHVAVVVRVARQEEDLQLVEEPRLVGRQPGHLVLGHRPHLVVAVAAVAQLAGAGQLRPGRLEAPERRRRRARGGPSPCRGA